MPTRTIGLSQDAYQRLAALKGEGESFSDVVRRLTGGHLLRRLAGSMDRGTALHDRAVIAEGRARADRDRDVRARQIARKLARRTR